MHFNCGVITGLGLSLNGSTLRVTVNLIPENRSIIATMTFADVTDVTFPEVNDLALIGFHDGEDDSAYVVKLVTTDEELIPEFAQLGHSVRYARPGTKLYLGSDTKVGIGRPNVEPTEALVLGNQLNTFLTNLLTYMKNMATELASHTHPVSVTVATTGTAAAQSGTGTGTAAAPADAAAFTAYSTDFSNLSTSPVGNGNLLSTIAFTESGDAET
jgi:hypothetical protein